MIWIPVTERMPELDERVLTLAMGRYYAIKIHILRHFVGIDWWMGEQNFVVSEGDVTHWMPLPPEPVCTSDDFHRQYLGKLLLETA